MKEKKVLLEGTSYVNCRMVSIKKNNKKRTKIKQSIQERRNKKKKYESFDINLMIRQNPSFFITNTHLLKKVSPSYYSSYYLLL